MKAETGAALHWISLMKVAARVGPGVRWNGISFPTWPGSAHPSGTRMQKAYSTDLDFAKTKGHMVRACIGRSGIFP